MILLWRQTCSLHMQLFACSAAGCFVNAIVTVSPHYQGSGVNTAAVGRFLMMLLTTVHVVVS